MPHPLHGLPSPVGLLGSCQSPTHAYWLEAHRPQQVPDGPAPTLRPEQPTVLELAHTCRPAAGLAEALGSLVVLRTIPPGWRRLMQQLRAQGKPVVLLLDDALLTPRALQELPLGYRWRLWWGVTRHWRRLAQIVTTLWVTTPELADLCQQQLKAACPPIQLMPLQPPLQVLAPPRVFRLAYHGSASHRAELAWLLPLLTRLQAQRSDCLLELVLDAHWRRRFRSLPRTRVLYPMDWTTYCLDTGNRSVDLMLVPLLPSPWNAGRAAVKVFDTARLAAVGLYSDRAPYRSVVRHNHDGLLLPDDPDAWLTAIDDLLNDPSRRLSLAANARQRALVLSGP